MTTFSFPLADIVSVTTEKLPSRRRTDGVADLLNWMTGDLLEPSQIPRATDVCKAELIAQHPFLAGLEPSGVRTEADLAAWLVEAERVHGEYLTVVALADWGRQESAEDVLGRLRHRREGSTRFRPGSGDAHPA
ncbi:hypothetical protein [Kitasatospora sp. NBC_01539]|uniref:DUF7736 domain-containing protein n=1 Tax=Kitasatospora sp. NBC_01539 TaxID=2903577 RepID=UPI003860267B